MKELLVKNKKYRVWNAFWVVFRCSKINAFLVICNSIISALIPSLQVLSTAYFVNSVLDMLKTKASVSTIVLPATYMFLLLVLIHGILPLSFFAKVKLELKIKEKLRMEFLSVSSRLEYQYFEDDKTLDLISRVSTTPETNFMKIFDDMLACCNFAIRLVSILTIIAVYVWGVVVAIAVLFIPFLYVSIKAGRANYQTNIEVTKLQRKYTYMGEVLSTRDYVDERSLYGFGDKVNQLWIKNYEVARKRQLKTEKFWFIRMKSMGLLTSGVCIATLFLLLIPTLDGILSVGLFMSLVGTIFDLINAMSWEFTGHIDNITRDNELMKDLTAYLKLNTIKESVNKSKEPFEFKSLEFKNVSFRYPNGKENVLNGVSFKIEAGNHYSLVGSNGSGKTTIIKLLTGLYRDYEGEILLNDIPLRQCPQDVINSLCSNVFQDFARYSLSLRENIKIGDIHSMDVMNDEKICSILKDINFDINRMDKNLDVQLGKLQEEGVDISGGQWQKIAIARAVVNSAPLRLLDEPTAALDPLSETEIYKNFEKISKGHTTIFITHRLASVKTTNKIFVLDKGAVIESGTHEQLMEKKGIYCTMYEAQRGWYA